MEAFLTVLFLRVMPFFFKALFIVIIGRIAWPLAIIITLYFVLEVGLAATRSIASQGVDPMSAVTVPASPAPAARVWLAGVDPDEVFSCDDLSAEILDTLHEEKQHLIQALQQRQRLLAGHLAQAVLPTILVGGAGGAGRSVLQRRSGPAHAWREYFLTLNPIPVLATFIGMNIKPKEIYREKAPADLCRSSFPTVPLFACSILTPMPRLCAHLDAGADPRPACGL